ncbi:hypothetical protein L1987_64987 [Smallanthus sonchifolius]|uniref:Uncharacterized protein n=1 Tax=Smallanthus sonchifolius TaxID=185202 RepID=A0ACB9BT53_9ASTR|nr:hypothetical protein L1987_64987 [Smallanthus sonchifolius]
MLPYSDLIRIMELGEAHEPENEGGMHLWAYNAAKDEFTITAVRGQQMRCYSKAIFKMPSKDIKSLSELPLDNPINYPRGYELLRISLSAADSCFPADEHFCRGQPYLLKTRVAADRLLSNIKHLMLLISKSSAALDS